MTQSMSATIRAFPLTVAFVFFYIANFNIALASATYIGSPATALTILCDEAEAYPTCWSNETVVAGLSGTPSATITNDAQYNVTGWNRVAIAASPDLMRRNAPLAYYAAGFAEGVATYDDIWICWNNIMIDTLSVNRTFNRPSFFATMGAHYNYIMGFNAADTVAINRQVGRLMWLIRGLGDGYNVSWTSAGSPPERRLTLFDIFMLNIQPEIGEWMTATAHHALNGNGPAAPSRKRMSAQQQQQQDTRETDTNRLRFFDPHNPLLFYDSHCSALVRNAGSDLFFGHTTWWGYYSMYRQIKSYTLESTVTLSSYPGLISSMDDFYMTSHGLVVTETTLWVFNSTLYEQFLQPNTISEFLRVMSANYLSSSAPQWIKHYSTQNSGTYCNQYMVVDMKLFQPNQPIVANTLWVAEQLPGNVTSADMSDKLNSDKYWGSYNTPFFQNVFQISGDSLYKQQYGFVTDYGRKAIFAARAPQVMTISDMRAIMRYNDYANDPLSAIPNCTGAIDNTCQGQYARSPWFAVSSRGDLVTQFRNATQAQDNLGFDWPFFNGHLSGGSDGKVTAWSMLFPAADTTVNPTLSLHAINGPTAGNGLPLFRWSGVPQAVKPLGHPDLFNFSWVQYQTLTPSWPSLAAGSAPGLLYGLLAGLGLAVVVAVVIVVLVRTAARKRHLPPEEKEHALVTN